MLAAAICWACSSRPPFLKLNRHVRRSPGMASNGETRAPRSFADGGQALYRFARPDSLMPEAMTAGNTSR
jgi:hypothetical protein